MPPHLARGSPAAPTQFVTLAWLLNTAPLEPKTKLALSVLNHLLLGTSASALEQPLMASGLGASITGGGYSGGLQQATWQVRADRPLPCSQPSSAVYGPERAVAHFGV